VLAGGDVTKTTVYELTLPPAATETRSIRLEVLPDESLPAHGPGMIWYEGAKGDFFLSEFEVMAGGQRVAVAKATESYAGKPSSSKDESSAAKTIDGDMSSGWGIDRMQGRPSAAVYVLAEPVPAGTAVSVTLRSERHYACAVGCFRLSVSPRADAEARGHTAAEEAALATPAAARSSAEVELVRRRFLASAAELATPLEEIRRLEVSQNVSPISTIAEVRHEMVKQQRENGKNKGIVMDGRDIGTVVFPQAELKIFMTDTLVKKLQKLFFIQPKKRSF
jgi:hypothetical protein